MDIIQTIMEFIGSEEFMAWVDAIAKTMLAATSITILTPTKTDNNIINTALKVLNILSGNVLKNKNADDV